MEDGIIFVNGFDLTHYVYNRDPLPGDFSDSFKDSWRKVVYESETYSVLTEEEKEFLCSDISEDFMTKDKWSAEIHRIMSRVNINFQNKANKMEGHQQNNKYPDYIFTAADLDVMQQTSTWFKKNELWVKAFAIYNRENPDRPLGMGCRPCYTKVLLFIMSYQKNK